MKTIMKKPKTFKAWRLGDGSEEEKRMIREGKIRKQNDVYELFSQETIGHDAGEKAEAGDYFKIDSSGYPYPNRKESFERKNVSLGNDEWQEKPAVYSTWEVKDGSCEEIDWLVKSGRMRINEDDEEHYFNAVLWGALLSSPKTSHIVFYSITKDGSGTVVDADFNFVADKQFYETYDFTE